MKAVLARMVGGPEVLSWDEVTDIPDTAPAPGEVVLRVVATAVNRADLLQRQGLYEPPPGSSPVLGLECSGQVVEVGEGVRGWTVGDQACALLTGGGHAERVTVPAGQVLPVPEGLSLVEAAALPEVVCTAWSNLFLLAHLAPGETVLIHGGASGVGTMAIQLARSAGARVAVTAGSAEKLERCRELGAEILVNYRTEDFVTALREATVGAGADVVLDNMGAKYLARNVDVLAPSGRLVVIGMQGGTRAELDLGILLSKRAAVLGSTLRTRPAQEKAAIVASVREHVWPLLASRAVRPVIDRTFAIAKVADAHGYVESGVHVGKVVLTVP